MTEPNPNDVRVDRFSATLDFYAHSSGSKHEDDRTLLIDLLADAMHNFPGPDPGVWLRGLVREAEIHYLEEVRADYERVHARPAE